MSSQSGDEVEDSYPSFFTWVLWVLAGLCWLAAVLFISPAGKGQKDRGQTITSGIMLGLIFFGVSFLTHGSRSSDKANDDLKAANEAVAVAQRNYDQADAEYRAITGATGPASRTTYSQCVGRGMAYFQEIGSWPKLSDGRDARGVAAERCNRTTGAFDGLS